MRKEVMNIMVLVRIGQLDAIQGTDKILSLMGENEIGVSGSPNKNGALPLVGKSEGEAIPTDKDSSEHEHGTLENRIEAKEFCKCIPIPTPPEDGYEYMCYKCRLPIKSKTVDS